MGLEIRENVPLYKYTTLRAGGPARYFVEVESVEELKTAGRFASQTGLPFFVMGDGSNVLVDDKGYKGLVIRNKITGRKYSKLENEKIELLCGAGEEFDEVVKETVEKNFWGMENLSHIPGTVGATPVQNVGAYGVELADLIDRVETYHLPTGTTHVFEANDCNFSYRDSFFKTKSGKEHVITAVKFILDILPKPQLTYSDLKDKFTNTTPTQAEIRKEIINIRSNKFPDWKKFGTAGSFFKNPIVSFEKSNELLQHYPDLPTYKTTDGLTKVSLGYILDKICNLKGYRENEVELFSKQAMVLVNHGNKNADAIKQFAKSITEQVFKKTGIKIEPEVFYLK